MKSTTIPFREVGYFSPIILDYLSETPTLTPYFKYPPNKEHFKQAMADKEKVDRPLLVKCLKEQYKDVKVEPLVAQNIDALLNETTYSITTGHQLCLCTGPLYFLYKIISAINLTEQLQEQYPSHKFVPVYWMASEDHDFEEINHFHLFNKKWEWANNDGGAVGHLATASLAPLLNELQEVVGEGANAEAIMQLLKEAYLEHANLAAATRYLVNKLFGKYGLVVIDGDAPQLKATMNEVFEEELLAHKSHQLVTATDQSLSQHYKTQVHPREVNLFYLKDGLRERIVTAEEGFLINNTELLFSQKAMLQELKEHPERFSPNVVLRPLYQEKILPNLAYIGGGGELAYWMQLKRVFEHYEINFPMLLLRNSVLWVDKGAVKKLNKLGLNDKDLFRSEEVLVKQLVKSNTENTLHLEEEKAAVKAVFDAIASRSEAIDPTLVPSVQGELKRSLNAMEGLEKRFVRAEKKKQEVVLNQATGLKNKLFPSGHLQERQANWIGFYLKYGDGFVEQLKQHMQPLDGAFLILKEEDL